MYGLLWKTLEDWQRPSNSPSDASEHISAYHLIYEEDAPLWNLKEAHQVEETDEDLVSRYSKVDTYPQEQRI